ncbi:sulfotransferase [Dactylosporangium darangshiense]|uniref:Sulfotransferase family protein n=1 Tax=Dactylosporangium darangshiense TaxID=579108 RepID=A0ABP8DUB3_9ACTN
MKYSYAFIITYGRSGSTLLREILNSIPGACVRGENGNTLYHLYRSWCTVRDRKWQFEGEDLGPADPWHGIEIVDDAAYRSELTRSFIDAVLKPPSAATLIGFKEIRYGPEDMSRTNFFDYLNFLVDSFSNACLIFNTRDLNEVLASAWWSSLPQAEEILTESDRRIREAAACGAYPSFHIHYNDYAQNMDNLVPLFDFLGASFSELALRQVFCRRHAGGGRPQAELRGWELRQEGASGGPVTSGEWPGHL